MQCANALGTLILDADMDSSVVSIAPQARDDSRAQDRTLLAIRVGVDEFPSKTRRIERIQSLWIPQTHAGIVRYAQMRNCVDPPRPNHEDPT